MTLIDRASFTPRPKEVGVAFTPEALRADIARVRQAWKTYRKSHGRDCVYRFLKSIFDVVSIWDADRRAATRAHRALVEQRCETPNNIEPFAALMTVAAHPQTIDHRTLAKWSRVLRYGAEVKLPGTPLRKFIKKRGGINACALRFTRRFGKSTRRKIRRVLSDVPFND